MNNTMSNYSAWNSQHICCIMGGVNQLFKSQSPLLAILGLGLFRVNLVCFYLHIECEKYPLHLLVRSRITINTIPLAMS